MDYKVPSKHEKKGKAAAPAKAGLFSLNLQPPLTKSFFACKAARQKFFCSFYFEQLCLGWTLSAFQKAILHFLLDVFTK